MLDHVHVSTPKGYLKTRSLTFAGDKGYPSQAFRQELRRRGIKPVIPPNVRPKRHRPRRGRPLTLDTALYRHRHVVERTLGILKAHRRIVTHFKSMIQLVFLRIYLKKINLPNNA